MSLWRFFSVIALLVTACATNSCNICVSEPVIICDRGAPTIEAVLSTTLPDQIPFNVITRQGGKEIEQQGMIAQNQPFLYAFIADPSATQVTTTFEVQEKVVRVLNLDPSIACTR